MNISCSDGRRADTHVAHKVATRGAAPRNPRRLAGFSRARIFLTMRLPWLLAALVLSALLSYLHHIALVDFLYWRYEWFDIPMHYLGGVTLGVFLVALSPKYRPRSYMTAIAVLLIGWEAFEYLFGMPREQNYAFDTALDLLMGTLGAATTYAAARLSLWRSV